MVQTRRSLSHLVLERYRDVTDTKTDAKTELPWLIRVIYASSRGLKYLTVTSLQRRSCFWRCKKFLLRLGAESDMFYWSRGRPRHSKNR